MKRLKEGTKIGGVIIPKDKKLPIGSTEKIFKMEIGIVTRLLAPVRVFYWSEMTKELKEPLFTKLQVI